MAQFNLYVHGVPIGHEVCPCDAEEDYLKDFYSHDKEIKETSFMQIDIVNGKSFYTYLHKRNVSSEIGRPGSYFGMTVCFSKQFCTNVHTLYEILETIYQKICIGCLIKKEAGNERFLVKEIASAQYHGRPVVDYINTVFRQNMEKLLSGSFEDLDGFSNSVGEEKFSLKEVDSPLFCDTLKNRRVFVSPEYGTISVAYKNLQKEVEPLREEHGRFKQDNAKLKENNKNLAEEVAKLKKELSNKESSVGEKFKKQLEEVQSNYDKAEREKRGFEGKIKEAASAVGQIEEPIRTLTRLFASRLLEENKNDTRTQILNRSRNPLKTWLPIVNLVLLLFVLVFCGYGCYALSNLPESTAVVQGAEEPTAIEGTDTNNDLLEGATNTIVSNTSNEEVPSDYIDFEDCQIDISNYSGTGNLHKGIEYSLSVVKKEDSRAANVPQGDWKATTGPDGLPGIIISRNNFRVDENVAQRTNVRVYYVVNNDKVLSRTITVE